MKITNEQLKQIIKEELDNIMAEMADYSQMDGDQLYGELEDLYFLIVKDNAKSREEKTAAVREFEKVGKGGATVKEEIGLASRLAPG